MMYYNTQSYEHVKEQMQERLAEIDQMRRCVAVAKTRPSVLRGLAGRAGRLLIRLGTRLEQPSQQLEHMVG